MTGCASDIDHHSIMTKTAAAQLGHENPVVSCPKEPGQQKTTAVSLTYLPSTFGCRRHGDSLHEGSTVSFGGPLSQMNLLARLTRAFFTLPGSHQALPQKRCLVMWVAGHAHSKVVRATPGHNRLVMQNVQHLLCRRGHVKAESCRIQRFGSLRKIGFSWRHRILIDRLVFRLRLRWGPLGRLVT